MARLPAIPFRVLVGPTAAGKTDVIHELAASYGTGVISADAMMVYRGMDIGTAKPTKTEQGAISYAGLDLAEPDQSFSAFDYLSAVERQMTGIANSDQWIIAGGTGLYIKCLLCGLEKVEGPDTALRDEGEAIHSTHGFPALQEWCRKIIPTIEELLPAGDRGNPRRWIRAVERGRNGAAVSTFHIPPHVKIVGLSWPREELERRIIKRVHGMYDNGLRDEVISLKRKFSQFSVTAEKAIGYAEAFEVINGTLSVEEAKNRTIIRTRQYAKRQMTWFRNQFETHWIDLTPGDTIKAIAHRVNDYWNNHG